jgi:hypothetical protein
MYPRGGAHLVRRLPRPSLGLGAAHRLSFFTIAFLPATDIGLSLASLPTGTHNTRGNPQDYVLSTVSIDERVSFATRPFTVRRNGPYQISY